MRGLPTMQLCYHLLVLLSQMTPACRLSDPLCPNSRDCRDQGTLSRKPAIVVTVSTQRGRQQHYHLYTYFSRYDSE